MDKNRTLKFIRSVFNLIVNRVGFLYLIVFLIFFYFIGGNFEVSSEIQALNRIMPPFEPLVEFTEKGTSIDGDILDQQVLYFKNVLKHMKGFSAADEMLGLSYFYQGNKELAERFLQEAVANNPDSFWFFYNLGLYYYKAKDYSQAITYFKKALGCSPKRTMQFMYTSKIYLPIFLASKLDMNKELGSRLQRGYSYNYRFIIQSYLEQEDYQNVLTHAVAGIQTNLDQEGVYQYYAGMAAYYLKDFKTAIYYLQESIKRNPRYSNAFYYLGMSVQALGKEDLANNFLKQAEILKTPQDSLQEELAHKELQIY